MRDICTNWLCLRQTPKDAPARKEWPTPAEGMARLTKPTSPVDLYESNAFANSVNCFEVR